MAAPERPRLRQGETPQSDSFQERWNEYLKAAALYEATEAQKELQAEDAAKTASRDVLKESKAAPSKPAATTPKPSGSKPGDEKKGVSGTAQKLRNRGRQIDSAVDAAMSGVRQADEDAKR